MCSALLQGERSVRGMRDHVELVITINTLTLLYTSSVPAPPKGQYVCERKKINVVPYYLSSSSP